MFKILNDSLESLSFLYIHSSLTLQFIGPNMLWHVVKLYLMRDFVILVQDIFCWVINMNIFTRNFSSQRFISLPLLKCNVVLFTLLTVRNTQCYKNLVFTLYSGRKCWCHCCIANFLVTKYKFAR